MKSGLIFLVLLLFLILPVSLNNATSENVLYIIIQGPVKVTVMFQNYTIITVNSSTTIHFTGNIYISASAPGFYNLYVNGTEQQSGTYSATINTSETFYFKAVPQLISLKINLLGNGNVTLYLENITERIVQFFSGNMSEVSPEVIHINHNETINLFPPFFAIAVESNKTFTVNNDYIPTNYYYMYLTSPTNITLNINFNIQNENKLPPNYTTVKIYIVNGTYTISLLNESFENLSLFSSFVIYTSFTTNKSITLVAPLGSTILINSTKMFYVNGTGAIPQPSIGGQSQNVNIQASIIVNPSNNQGYLLYTLQNNGNTEVNITSIIIDDQVIKTHIVLKPGETITNETLLPEKYTVGQQYTVVFEGENANGNLFVQSMIVVATSTSGSTITTSTNYNNNEESSGYEYLTTVTKNMVLVVSYSPTSKIPVTSTTTRPTITISSSTIPTTHLVTSTTVSHPLLRFDYYYIIIAIVVIIITYLMLRRKEEKEKKKALKKKKKKKDN